MAIKIYSFIFAMWILMLIGGGLMVLVIGPFSLGSIVGDINPIILSGIKVSIALVLIFIWVFTLTKVKNWIFRTDIKS
jgi:hypothetical protein|tara:strand:+ start:138 stop:371 length:234 start_codon:yes stop_codon:yes gene_type:complete